MGREPLRYTLQKGSTVFTRWVREDAVLTARRGRWMPAMLVSFLVWVVVAPVHAQDPPPVTVGAGLQTSFLHHRPAEGDPVDNFRLNSLRFYLNGQASDNISLMVSTDINYGGTLFVCPEDGSCGAGFGNQGNEVQVLDAVAQIAISDKFNIWFGRHLPPSVPHPVLWTQVNATPPGVARAPRGPRSACDTRASRAARSCCTAPRTRSLRRVPP